MHNINGIILRNVLKCVSNGHLQRNSQRFKTFPCWLCHVLLILLLHLSMLTQMLFQAVFKMITNRAFYIASKINLKSISSRFVYVYIFTAAQVFLTILLLGRNKNNEFILSYSMMLIPLFRFFSVLLIDRHAYRCVKCSLDAFNGWWMRTLNIWIWYDVMWCDALWCVFTVNITFRSISCACVIHFERRFVVYLFS